MSAPALAAVLELERFLEMLAGPAREQGFLELRYRLEHGKQLGRCFEHVTRLGGLATRARLLARRVDVYVGCAPRSRRAGTKDAIERGWTLWVDCDAPAAVDALECFEPQPAVLIASGSGRHRHAYWPLAAPLPAGELERANRRLAFTLGADLGSVTNAAALLRPPTTRSYKHTPPAPVEALRLEPDRRLPAVAIVGELADPPAPERPPAKAARRRGAAGRTSDPLLKLAPAVYVGRLLGVQVPRGRKVACPFHEDRTPSLHVYHAPEDGWTCFSTKCAEPDGRQRGGTIYDLAGPLYGYATEGAQFLQLKRELLRLFGLAETRDA